MDVWVWSRNKAAVIAMEGAIVIMTDENTAKSKQHQVDIDLLLTLIASCTKSFSHQLKQLMDEFIAIFFGD